MFRGRRGESRGCCVVIPVGCLLPVLGVLLLSGLAFAGFSRPADEAETPIQTLLEPAL